MQYQILVFATADLLAAYEIDAWGKADVISLDGSITMKYRGSDDLRRFSDYIKDSFNIERYDEIDLSVMVLNCGMDAVSVFCLTGLFSGVAGYEVLDIRRVLPLAATAMGRTRKEGTANFSLLDARYAVCTGEDLQTECRCLDDEAGEVIELRPEHFGFLFRFDAGKFTADDEPLRKAQAEWDAKQKDYDKQIAELTERLCNEKERAERQGQEAVSYQERIEILERREKERDKRRYLVRVPSWEEISRMIKKYNECRSTQIDANKRMLDHYEVVFGSVGVGILGLVSDPIKDNDFVRKDTTFAWLKGISSNGNALWGNEQYNIFSPQPVLFSAPEGGRIFFLVENKQSVNEGDAIAIISATDTREEALWWYESLPNTEK